MTSAYVLTAAAEADLRGIVRYTRGQWGDAQVRIYMTKLAQCIERLASGRRGGERMDAVHPGLQMGRCQQHRVFFLPQEDGPTLVIAILHERMDLMARLASRLARLEGADDPSFGG